MKTKVTVVIDVPWIDGSKSFSFTLEEFNLGKADITGLILNAIGVDGEAYLSWLENDGKVRCVAITKKGNQCMGHVPDLRIDDPREWVKANLIGGYCSIHGGV